MNRRKFLANLALSFTILPGAGRVWRTERKFDWEKLWDDLFAIRQARICDLAAVDPEYCCIMEPGPVFNLVSETAEVLVEVPERVWHNFSRDL